MDAQQRDTAHRQGNETDPTKIEDRKFVHGADKFWFLYLTDADKYDKSLAENWKGDTDGILIFTGLFAATVAAFTIESYKLLKPDSGDDTVTLLAQMSQQLAAISNGTHLPALPSVPDTSSFRAPRYGLHVNILWFTSLALSLICALTATLVQQWVRKYLQGVQRRGPPHKRGPVHIYLLMGMHRFKLGHAVDLVISLLHLSVFLFLSGLIVFLLALNRTLGYIVLSFMIVGAMIYLVLSVLPLIFFDCPYETPLAFFMRKFGLGLLKHISVRMRMTFEMLFRDRLPMPVGHRSPAAGADPPHTPYTRALRTLKTGEQYMTTLCHGRVPFLKNMDVASDENMKYALDLCLQNIDEHHERETFLQPLMDLVRSSEERTSQQQTCRLLCEPSILDSFISLFLSCGAPGRKAAYYMSDRTMSHRLGICFAFMRLLRSVLSEDEVLPVKRYISNEVDKAPSLDSEEWTLPNNSCSILESCIHAHYASINLESCFTSLLKLIWTVKLALYKVTDYSIMEGLEHTIRYLTRSSLSNGMQVEDQCLKEFIQYMCEIMERCPAGSLAFSMGLITGKGPYFPISLHNVWRYPFVKFETRETRFLWVYMLLREYAEQILDMIIRDRSYRRGSALREIEDVSRTHVRYTGPWPLPRDHFRFLDSLSFDGFTSAYPTDQHGGEESQPAVVEALHVIPEQAASTDTRHAPISNGGSVVASTSAVPQPSQLFSSSEASHSGVEGSESVYLSARSKNGSEDSLSTDDDRDRSAQGLDDDEHLRNTETNAPSTVYPIEARGQEVEEEEWV